MKVQTNCQWYLAYYPIKFASPFVETEPFILATSHNSLELPFQDTIKFSFLPLFTLSCSNSPLFFLQQQRPSLESNQDMTRILMKNFISLTRYISRLICFCQNNLYHSFQFLTWTALCWLRSLHLQCLSIWSHAENISVLYQKQTNKKAAKRSTPLVLLKFLQ